MKRTIWNALALSSSTNSFSKHPAVVQELKFPCSDGTILAGQRWTTDSGNKDYNNILLCLHGWLDNCRSFHHLAPRLTALGGQVFVLDLPGHGCSSHREAPPVVQAEMIYYVSEVMNHVISSVEEGENPKITLIGHSLGAGIAGLYAAAFPEQVEKLVLLEGAGFLARDAKDTALHVRNHVVKRSKTKASKQKQPRVYPSLDLAVQTRVQSARQLPGKQTISYEAAEELVRRGTYTLDDGVQFRHDVRFTWPSIQYMTWEQNCGIFEAINADCCVVLAEDGWPFDPRLSEETMRLLQPTTFETLPGSHYFHADPSTADAVADVVFSFLSD